VELANFIFLMWLLKRRKFDGQVIGAFMFHLWRGPILPGVFARRSRPRVGIGGVMSGTQLIAIGLVIAGGLIWWLRPGAKAVPAHPVEATR